MWDKINTQKIRGALMIIDDLLIDLKNEIQNAEGEKLDKLVFLSRSLLELKAYQKMYEDDLIRVNSYYETLENEFNRTQELLGGE